MAQKKEKPDQPEEVSGSVGESQDFTTGRAESEGRLASGNVRDGQAATEDEVNRDEG